MTNHERLKILSDEEIAALLLVEHCPDCILSRSECDRYYEADPSRCKEKLIGWLRSSEKEDITEEKHETETDCIRESCDTVLRDGSDTYLINTSFHREFDRKKSPMFVTVWARTNISKINGEKEVNLNHMFDNRFLDLSTDRYEDKQEEIIDAVCEMHKDIVEQCKALIRDGSI